jgi:2-phosphoglycerate kinase
MVLAFSRLAAMASPGRLPGRLWRMAGSTHTAPWRVLLVGGGSGVGKTAVTAALARHFGVPRLLVDDVRLSLQEFIAAEQYPDPNHSSRIPACGSTRPRRSATG